MKENVFTPRSGASTDQTFIKDSEVEMERTDTLEKLEQLCKIRQTGMDALKESALTAGRVCEALRDWYGAKLWTGEDTG